MAWPEAEQLFELIDDHQDILIRRNSGLTNRLDETQSTATQSGFDQHAICAGELRIGTQHIGSIESLGQVSDRILAWANGCDSPAGARRRHESALERGYEPGPDQRRLPASRSAHHRQETTG